MSEFFYRITVWLGNIYQGVWSWVLDLDRQEALVFLLAAGALGFMCLRGFGSRKDY